MRLIRGQGALEYLSTYGWAVLVVMIVGIMLWQLGIIDMGSVTTPTSTGFSRIKPLLTTCDMKKDVFGPGKDGFKCIFLNDAGAKIFIKDVKVKVDGYCFNEVDFSDIIPSSLCPYCSCLGIHQYDDETCQSSTPAAVSFCGQPNVPIDKGGEILIYGFSSGNPSFSYSSSLGPGAVTKIEVEVTYDIVAGGVMASKSDLGAINILYQ